MPTGSVVSGLMVWRDHDVMVLGEGLAPGAVRMLARRRTAVLRIEDAWHRPEYPDEVGGADIYSAELDDGVRDPEGFATWLTRRASSASGA